ncbi:MAG: 16S rRNA (guanine(527)-N(7))-methyltransferase RsmG [Chloroflexi bacterium]|nr:16S rRNA (guanine(527)-N(7))-methyltransferase RsmG [Chloroflexota bacterium]
MELLIAGARKLGYELCERQLGQFSIYYQELTDWNRRMNLTAITDYEGVQIKHFLDSLTVALALDSRSGENLRVMDVGTGAGFPGVPLKVLLPGITLTLLEATAKKAGFLRHLTEILGLGDVEIVTGRAEEVAHLETYREKFNVVLSRAVAPLSVLVELTLPFCVLGGRLIAQKSGSVEEEITRAEKAIRVLGGSLWEVKKVGIQELGADRCLVVIDKIEPTPPGYPRRPGMPAKKPIT